MADFVQSNVTKSVVRELAEPIADVATFNTFTLPSYRLNTPPFRLCIMEALHRPMEMGRIGTHIAKYDSDKITKIREKIEVVFGRPSSWNDAAISERYNITPDGVLIMIIR